MLIKNKNHKVIPKSFENIKLKPQEKLVATIQTEAFYSQNSKLCGAMDEVRTSFRTFDFVYPIPDYSLEFFCKQFSTS